MAVVAIPVYLGAGVLLTDAMGAGQTGGGLPAMVAAYFFEHTLDYLLLALLVAGGQAVRFSWVSLRRDALFGTARSADSAVRVGGVSRASI
jgi:hypothetical protein